MSGALQGLKILDFTTMLPGPYATMMMADMGADVLRVISGKRTDLIFYMPPLVPDMNISAMAAYLWRGKRSITLNLKDPLAREIVGRLIGEYDIVIEQFRPGVMERLGLDYAALKKINPRLIYCSITGYGQNGPLRDRAGHDINYLARSGIISYSGRKNTVPALMGVQIADLSSGAQNAIIGILAALHHRTVSGSGQYLDISMTDGAQALHGLFGAAYLVDEKEPKREETILNGGSIYDFYETEDGRYLSFGALEPGFFNACCTAMGCSELACEGIAPADAAKNKNEIKRVFKTKTLAEWIDLFAGVDVCIEPVLTMDEVAADPQTKAREMIVDVPLPDGKKVRQFANPIKFSTTPPQYNFAGLPPGNAYAGSHAGVRLQRKGNSRI